MSDLFLIEGPAVISFSGGRTSGYMLRRILDAGLQPDVHVLFADTGKEFPETYAFVEAVRAHWGVTIQRVERPGGFTQLITDKKFLPNPVARFCTSDLKLKPIAAAMKAHGYPEWTDVIGLRADEPSRVAKMRGQPRDVALPLVDAGIVKADVLAFWKGHAFDLQLPVDVSNCDLCFLKGVNKRRQIIRDRPETVGWWIEQEWRIGGRFRSDAPSYADLAAQPDLFKDGIDEMTECFCTD